MIPLLTYYTCAFCPKTFSGINELPIHYQKIHAINKSSGKRSKVQDVVIILKPDGTKLEDAVLVLKSTNDNDKKENIKESPLKTKNDIKETKTQISPFKDNLKSIHSNTTDLKPNESENIEKVNNKNVIYQVKESS